MPIGTTKHPCVGRRVEIPAYSDLWMRGARFGTVARVIDRSKARYLDPKDPRGQTLFRVRMDHPDAQSRLYGYVADDCQFL